MKKIFLVVQIIFSVVFLSCSSDDPVSLNKTVRYYAIILSSNDASVIKTITFTNANGSDTQEFVGVFNRTISFAPGTVVNLSASGTTSSVLNIRVRVEIYVDNSLAASQENDGPGSAFASVSVTVP
ncbi:MAG: hypothetical protein IPM56_08705 [Ignavibacteriales bacterium]|nr:MAG: hypothetical protein IPM56_08705 [Ignavibacteriales bacterium]